MLTYIRNTFGRDSANVLQTEHTHTVHVKHELFNNLATPRMYTAVSPAHWSNQLTPASRIGGIPEKLRTRQTFGFSG